MRLRLLRSVCGSRDEGGCNECCGGLRLGLDVRRETFVRISVSKVGKLGASVICKPRTELTAAILSNKLSHPSFCGSPFQKARAVYCCCESMGILSIWNQSHLLATVRGSFPPHRPIPHERTQQVRSHKDANIIMLAAHLRSGKVEFSGMLVQYRTG